MGYCAVITCRNSSRNEKKSSSGVTFHLFPKDPKIKSVWAKLVGRSDDWIPRKYTYICSKHFTPDCFFQTKNNLRRLSPHAIPSLLLPAWAENANETEVPEASTSSRSSSVMSCISETSMEIMEGKVALITGGASGIGKTCVEYFLENGAKKVYIADINLTEGQKVEQEFNEKFGENKAKFVKCDIRNSCEFEDTFKIIYEENKNLDVLLNNAGTGENPTVFDVNLFGTLTGIELGLKYMGEKNERKGGVIINTISTVGLKGAPYMPRYVASKHAVAGLTKVFSEPCYFKKTNVKVIGVCPALTDTNIFVTNEVKELQGLCDNEKPQSPKVVAECVMEILKNGENGSFWVAEDGEFYEIEMPCYKKLRKNKN